MTRAPAGGTLQPQKTDRRRGRSCLLAQAPQQKQQQEATAALMNEINGCFSMLSCMVRDDSSSVGRSPPQQRAASRRRPHAPYPTTTIHKQKKNTSAHDEDILRYLLTDGGAAV